MAEVENTNATVEEKSTEKATEEKDVKANKDTKESDKKYTDEDVNNISKAVQKFMKELGIEDVEEAKGILAKAREEKEKNMSIDEKTQKIIEKGQKSTLKAMDLTIENALLRKHVDDSKVNRAARLVNKEAILNENGEIDENKLSEEIEEVIKEFPELIPTAENQTTGFKIGGDGKEDKQDDPMIKMRKIMGLK